MSQGSFFQEQMSSPVRRMAWSWCRPSLPPRVDCQWQKLLSVWSAWWLITKPSCEIRPTKGSRMRDNIVCMEGSCGHKVLWIQRRELSLKLNGTPSAWRNIRKTTSSRHTKRKGSSISLHVLLVLRSLPGLYKQLASSLNICYVRGSMRTWAGTLIK